MMSENNIRKISQDMDAYRKAIENAEAALAEAERELTIALAECEDREHGETAAALDAQPAAENAEAMEAYEAQLAEENAEAMASYSDDDGITEEYVARGEGCIIDDDGNWVSVDDDRLDAYPEYWKD